MMYNTDTEILFPSRVIASLRDLREESWRELVDRVVCQKSDSQDHLAFVLLMVRMCSCTSCHADSFRAQRGCTRCASQAVSHARASDSDLLSLYREAHRDIQLYLKQEQVPG